MTDMQPITEEQKRAEAKATVALLGLGMMIVGGLLAWGIGGGMVVAGLWLSMAVMSDFRG